ncbi:hypothetical protein [Micromonospora sp. NPDC049301]|uniref:hypothetical protein n=1 Tax=Micromonospora sp. NPDC049301 TaxID=3155723 RepID=UPI003426A8F8
MQRLMRWWRGHSPAEKATWGAAILGGCIGLIGTLVAAIIQVAGTNSEPTASGATAPVTTPQTPTIETWTTTPAPTGYPSDTDSPSPGPISESPTPDGPTAEPDTALLADLDQVYDDNNFAGVKATRIGNTLYDRSPGMGCLTTRSMAVEWNTAGYERFSALLGIADSDDEGSRIAIQIKFKDQDGKTLKSGVVVSLGHPAQVSFPLGNATRLRVECLADDKSGSERGRHVTLRLGEATVSRGTAVS